MTEGGKRHSLNQSSVAAVSSPHLIRDFCFEIWHPCECFLSANDAGLSSAAWKSLEKYTFRLHSTETASWLSRNLRKAVTLFRWSSQLIHKFQCRSTKYFNFKCRFENVYLLSHSGISSLATSNYTNISVQWIKSWNIILKTTLSSILVWTCDLSALDDNGSPRDNWFASA